MNSDKKGGFMQSIQLPSGYGQEVYVDPDELYIKPEWINQELHYINFPDIPISQSNPVYEAYKEMFKYWFWNYRGSLIIRIIKELELSGEF